MSTPITRLPPPTTSFVTQQASSFGQPIYTINPIWYTALLNIAIGNETEITLEGDVLANGFSPLTTTLTTTGVAAGSYGSGTSIPVLTIDNKGRITHATQAIVNLPSMARTFALMGA